MNFFGGNKSKLETDFTENIKNLKNEIPMLASNLQRTTNLIINPGASETIIADSDQNEAVLINRVPASRLVGQEPTQPKLQLFTFIISYSFFWCKRYTPHRNGTLIR